MFEAFHPPLSYVVNAVLSAHGVSRANLAWVSILAGSAKLGLIWWGLEHYLPRRPWGVERTPFGPGAIAELEQ